MRPYQKPHPQVWIPSTVSVETVRWSAQHRYPLVLLATRLGPTKDAFDMYHDAAAEFGYESGTQHVSYLWKVHVDETEELAEEVGRKYLSGVSGWKRPGSAPPDASAPTAAHTRSRRTTIPS